MLWLHMLTCFGCICWQVLVTYIDKFWLHILTCFGYICCHVLVTYIDMFWLHMLTSFGYIYWHVLVTYVDMFFSCYRYFAMHWLLMMVQTSAPKYCQKQNTSLIYLRYYTLPTCYTYTINMSFCYEFEKGIRYAHLWRDEMLKAY